MTRYRARACCYRRGRARHGRGSTSTPVIVHHQSVNLGDHRLHMVAMASRTVCLLDVLHAVVRLHDELAMRNHGVVDLSPGLFDQLDMRGAQLLKSSDATRGVRGLRVALHCGLHILELGLDLLLHVLELCLCHSFGPFQLAFGTLGHVVDSVLEHLIAVEEPAHLLLDLLLGVLHHLLDLRVHLLDLLGDGLGQHHDLVLDDVQEPNMLELHGNLGTDQLLEVAADVLNVALQKKQPSAHVIELSVGGTNLQLCMIKTLLGRPIRWHALPWLCTVACCAIATSIVHATVRVCACRALRTAVPLGTEDG